MLINCDALGFVTNHSQESIAWKYSDEVAEVSFLANVFHCVIFSLYSKYSTLVFRYS
jgi:hypothetical protein